MPSDPKKDLKNIQAISGSRLVIEALSTKDLMETLKLLYKIEKDDDEYTKVIKEYLPAEATDYINKIRAIEYENKPHYDIFKELVPLLNELQNKLLSSFKEKHSNEHLKENELFYKKYTTKLNKTPIGEDNPIPQLEDSKLSYEEFLNAIDSTGVAVNTDIYNDLYINNLKKTVEDVVSKDEYKNNIKSINEHLAKTFNYYDKPA